MQKKLVQVLGAVQISFALSISPLVDCVFWGISAAQAASTPATNPTPTAALTANPTSITSGQPSTLTWSSANAGSCTGTGFSTGNAISGSVTVTPSTTTTYSVSCAGSGGTLNASATVTVVASPGIRLVQTRQPARRRGEHLFRRDDQSAH
jgi:hypothetical protein